MITGNGINTVTVNGKVKHITELDDITLCLEWTKLREENNRLYEINNQANRGWRGFILRLIGVNLPDKRTEFTQCLLLTRNICKRKLTAVCSHQTRIGNLDAHLI